MLQVPVTSSGNSDFDITLEGTTYTFQYRFNTRNKRNFLSILKDDVPLIMGMRLIENGFTNLLYTNIEAPPGLLFVAPLKDQVDIATLGNTGIDLDYTLAYFTSLEVVIE